MSKHMARTVFDNANLALVHVGVCAVLRPTQVDHNEVAVSALLLVGLRREPDIGRLSKPTALAAVRHGGCCVATAWALQSHGAADTD